MIDCPNHTSAPAGGLAIPPCPLDVSRPEIVAALTQGRNLVLSALPGAGKSSRVPLWLMDQPWLEGRRILLLEPRRVAARALARYMAALLGEQPGGLVGYRMRDESRMGSNTRVEVVTEGVLTRMLQDNPDLPDIACVIFDEFHERSLIADTGLALCLESQAALRPDLRIESLRGNVDTRLRKLREGVYDAIILASAGMNRLGLSAPYMHALDPQTFLPAVGQGAIGIECREDDYELFTLLVELEDTPTRVCVEAERGFLAGLEGGCQVPIAGHARLENDESFVLEGLVAEVDGSLILREAQQGHTSKARQVGLELAETLLARGGRAILEKLYQQ